MDGTVICSGLSLRETLETGGEVKVLRRSSRVEILGEETWYRVRTRDGLEGYVFADFVEKDLVPEVAGDEFLGEGGLDFESAPGLSPTCNLQPFHHERFIGNPVTADVDFFPLLEQIASLAGLHGLSVFVTSSARDPKMVVRGAIVTPATRSNHMVGHAIDMNLRSDAGQFFNSKSLGDLENQPQPVQDFIAAIRQDPVLRWGGDFRERDVVHIDDGLNLRHPDVWDTKLASRA